MNSHAFTVSQYHRMGEVGIFTEDDQVELIEGAVVAMSPIGPRHAACVNKFAAFIHDRTSSRAAILSVHNPLVLSEYSELLPDISILHARDDFYASGHPGPEDVLLVIEVADASLLYDRNTKVPLYARAGIAEVWIMDLVKNVVDMYSSPAASVYENQQRFERGALVKSIALPELAIAVDEMLIA